MDIISTTILFFLISLTPLIRCPTSTINIKGILSSSTSSTTSATSTTSTTSTTSAPSAPSAPSSSTSSFSFTFIHDAIHGYDFIFE